MKKVLMSLFTIAIVGALITGGAIAYFSDTETSKDNIFTAGTIDISVNGENPWQGDGDFTLADMKPCEYHKFTTTIKNVGTNPCLVWKHIDVVEQTGGVTSFSGASSEPEYVEGGGQFDASGNPTGTGYVERCNLAAYIIYDLFVNDVAIFADTDYVRIDNIDCTWVYLGQLDVGEDWVVQQSYHLMSWPDAAEPEVTNWAQGDTIKFNVEFYAEQIGGTGPIGTSPSMLLENKDPVTWAVISGDGISGTLIYNTAGLTFDYSFSGTVPVSGGNYELIYYVDPWPGTGGCTIGSGTASGTSLTISGSVNLGFDLVNAKIWLVLDADYDGAKMIAWNPSSYLFETNMINYNDTGP